LLGRGNTIARYRVTQRFVSPEYGETVQLLERRDGGERLGGDRF
jgi:hypothetical protein